MREDILERDVREGEREGESKEERDLKEIGLGRGESISKALTNPVKGLGPRVVGLKHFLHKGNPLFKILY